MRLTHVGRVFLKAVRVVLAEVSRATTVAQAAARGESGRFRLAFTDTSAYVDAIPDLIALFAARHPNVVLKMLHMDWSELVPALRNGRIKAAFCNHVPVEDDVKSEVLFDEKIVLAVSRQHPLARLETVQLSQLRNERFIATPPRSLPHNFRDLKAEYIAHGLSLTEAIESSNRATQLSFVAAGMGVSPLTVRKRGPVEREVLFKPLPELKFRMPNVLLWTEEEGPTPLIQSLREISQQLRPTL